ncbi:MAG: VOC family protein [Omnitrophica WOR_2 bacterium]
MSIPADTHLGPIQINVPDISRSIQFYQQSLGLQLLDRSEKSARLGAGKPEPILMLEQNGNGRPPAGKTGLYHMAILVPSRYDLARSIRRLMEAGWPIEGYADHGVSEAVYLSDPDGNGIEIYRDRPRLEWSYRNGQVQMVTDPIDLEGLLGELQGKDGMEAGMNPDTRLGHVHLKVSSIPDAVQFYVNVLGFDLVQRFGPRAGFVSAGGYHHHIGFNTWESDGAPPPPPGSPGLGYFTIVLPDPEALEQIIDRARQENIPVEPFGRGWQVKDPAGNAIVLMTG